MPIYISLMNLTDQGVKTIKDAPARIEQNIKGVEAAGGKLLSFYLTMGQYDYVAISEWPNDEAAMTYALVLGSTGNVRTATMKAFTTDEFAAMAKNLP
ncbi:MAG: GYD domain-containing protein [Deltaproteobacteria bacterium]|nr:GYD domain-containing protein [Deltaproteobacteria bacterium]